MDLVHCWRCRQFKGVLLYKKCNYFFPILQDFSTVALISPQKMYDTSLKLFHIAFRLNTEQLAYCKQKPSTAHACYPSEPTFAVRRRYRKALQMGVQGYFAASLIPRKGKLWLLNDHPKCSVPTGFGTNVPFLYCEKWSGRHAQYSSYDLWYEFHIPYMEDLLFRFD